MMMIDYWLKQVKGVSLYDLAEAIDELDLRVKVKDNKKANEMKLSDRI